MEARYANTGLFAVLVLSLWEHFSGLRLSMLWKVGTGWISTCVTFNFFYLVKNRYINANSVIRVRANLGLPA